MPRRRLSVEAWRDAVLRVSGQLDAEVGGKSVEVSDPSVTRRSVYAQVSRFQLDPLLALFDFPDPNVHASRRVETNTPLQKLFLLNSEFMNVHSKYIAGELDTTQSSSATADELFRKVLGRLPSEQERNSMTEFASSHSDESWSRLAQILLASNEFWIVD